MKSEKLQILRHSLSHVMAQAVKNLFPAKIAIGPAIDNGFYYDFDFLDKKPSEKDFPLIEAEMKKIIKKNVDFIRKEISRDEALELFKDEPYKCELIKNLPSDQTISIFTQDSFTDLCRGPHIKNSCELDENSFKILSIAGAYWRGDVNRPMLTRIYAAAFENSEALSKYLAQIEEAEKRDHRKLGVALDLFHLDGENPGQIFWHPAGWTIYCELKNYMREKTLASGYQEVNTPAIMPRSLWERSGHWAHYQKNMFVTESEKRIFAVKPMNCPGAVEIFNSKIRSYRDLPMRLSEFGNCVRNEASGTLHGVLRVRGFVQDDAHIFCTEEQIESETIKFCQLLRGVYADFGFDKNLLVKLSTMPDDHAGTEETWAQAENSLGKACLAAGLKYEIQPKEGAFYGPKLEFTLTDAIGREWQCGTLQLDYVLPSDERLNAQYVGADNKKHHPVMLHRAVLGSLERFLGILIENYAGAFPAWLSPVQVAIVPVSDEFDSFAQEIFQKLCEKKIRTQSYTGGGNLKAKIKLASENRIPYVLIVGEKEKVQGTVSVRFRHSSGLGQKTFLLDDFILYAKEKIENRVNGI